jgi:hypothetical protein
VFFGRAGILDALDPDGVRLPPALPGFGDKTGAGSPWSGRRSSSTRPSRRSATAPEPGAHTKEVLLEIGHDWENIARYQEQAAIA